MAIESAEWVKKQEKIESYRDQKQGIIDDLRVCISYTPNRDNDLLCFMEQYLKAEIKNRPRLLEQIKYCINGEQYENPFLAYNHYDERHIEEFDHIFNEYIDRLKLSGGESTQVSRVIESTILKINELHDICRGQLIDSWRNERLTEYIVTVSQYAGLQNAKDIIEAKKLW
ncbi:hypothetical protein [Proteiniborus sp. MB09-C3]|uniref:hypothetical protein n=1 Tax=Proteiniborus sp. MB09-C3 TaxID=3050072 RepID=UPI002554832E|nr:hypothetical protein [Proteiniborus sp. MB09-C3]WIV13587.1 hypothetical protein QO263_07745 [Proteiniborus sp. MB09-C3]